MARRKMGMLRRPYGVPVNLDGDEDEFVARKSYDLGLPKTEYFRAFALPPNWKGELKLLRTKQKNMTIKFRRAPVSTSGHSEK